MRRRILLHILFWIVYVLFKTYLNYTTDTESKTNFSEIEKFTMSLIPQLIFLIVKVPLVYSIFFIMGKYLSEQWSISKSVLIIIIVFSLSIIAYVTINHIIILNWYYDLHFSFTENLLLGSITYAFFILCFTAGIAITLKLIRLNLKQKQMAQEIMKMKLETELNLLKAQTNPHFLFNTLNNIYALAIKKSDDTAPVVMKLSKLLRFMLYESGKNQILISQEVKLLEDYIELEKIRYNDRLTLTLSYKIVTPTAKITPLLLLPLIENAFKHGASESMNNVFIYIDIKETNNLLNVKIENSNELSAGGIVKESIGLKNIRRQLELTYGDFNLEINNRPDMFQVNLYINLESYGKV